MSLFQVLVPHWIFVDCEQMDQEVPDGVVGWTVCKWSTPSTVPYFLVMDQGSQWSVMMLHYLKEDQEHPWTFSSVHLVIVSSDRTRRIVLEYSSEPFVLKYNVLVLCKNALTVNMYICAQLYLNVKEITCLPLNNQRRGFFEAECLTCWMRQTNSWRIFSVDFCSVVWYLVRM